MTPQEAHAFMYNEIFVPAFMQKLAEYGIQPRTQEEAISFLRIGNKLHAAEESGTIKSASVNAVQEAEDALDYTLQAYGVGVPQEDEVIKQASHQLAANQDVQRAVLSLSMAMKQLSEEQSNQAA